jgi:dolichol-phosphate mannosyltransferase
VTPINPTASGLLVLVCTYNERHNLPSLVETIAAHQPTADILVVDDGSPDGTGDWVAEAARHQPQLKLRQRGSKLGLGTAIRHGLEYAIEHGYRYVVNLDADFSHDPAKIAALLEAADRQQADLVIGSRYVPGGGLAHCSWRRHLVSRTANGLARCLVGWKIRDCSSAYRCYRVAFLEQLELSQLRCAGYGFLEEILWAVLRQGGKVIETPIIYTERERGDSKISIREAVGTFQVLWRLSRQKTSHSPRVR